MIDYDEFKKVEIAIGEIRSVEKVENTDKLLCLQVDFGVKKLTPPRELSTQEGDEAGETVLPSATVVVPMERDIRQIISGIALYYPDPQVLVGKKCAFASNLEPRSIRGLQSNGMILAASTPEGAFSLLEVLPMIPAGTVIK